MSSRPPTGRIDRLGVDEPGRSESLLGNEAIVRAALESGVGFASGYPGTPSSEITDAFARLSGPLGIAFEYSINEKICVEMAFAASLAGARSICAMKHLGLMVAGDPLSTIPYIGVEAGMVIVSAGDPSCRTSPNEQDQRHLGPMLHFPILDPATPKEAYELTRLAFELSEETRLPVLLRVTTRVCHSRAAIEYGALPKAKIAGFRRDPSRYIPVPKAARRMRVELTQRMQIARERFEREGLLRIEGDSPKVVLCTGAPAAACADLLQSQAQNRAQAQADDGGPQLSLWTLPAVHPLPETPLIAALRTAEQVLVVEELSPFLETELMALCQREGIPTKILGKRSGHLPEAFEYEPEIIARGLEAAFGVELHLPTDRAPEQVPARPPSMCPGCQHRSSFMAARLAFDDDQLYFNDIGCYTLGFAPPLNVGDALLCMGAGFTLAAGVSRVTGQRTVGFMGDGTFFHAGMPALLDAAKEQANMIAVVLDNQVTAMTGFQDSPADHRGHDVPIERIVRALGVEQVEVVDPYDMSATVAAYTRAREAEGLSVIVARRSCPVYEIRLGERQRPTTHLGVDPDRCRSCGRDAHGLRCAQPVTEGYQRNLARARAIQTWPRDYAPPSEAPCSERCPLSLCIQGYVGHIAAGEYAEALGHILERTPLPDSVCRTCHRPCESACVRQDVDESVGINDLKRFVVDWAKRQTSQEGPTLPAIPMMMAAEPDNGLHVAVVGAGPSGLSAAHDLRLRGYAVTLFDASDRPGGILSRAIPSYRLPDAAVERDVARVLERGVKLVPNTRVGVDLPFDELRAKGFDAIYLAIGAHRPRSLALEGLDHADAPRELSALAFLERARRIQSSAAASTANREEQEHAAPLGRVVVIGGGNSAVDAARTARMLGADSVAMACLEARADMPALPDELVEAEEEGIAFHTRVRPLRFDPTRPGLIFVSLVGLDGDNDELVLPCDTLIMAIGQDPDLSLLDGSEVELATTEQGCLEIDEHTCETDLPGIFAGGDLVAGERTVTAAMGWGLRAAWGIDRRLRGEVADRRMPPPPPTRAAPVKWTGQTPARARRRPPTIAADARVSFAEIHAPLSEADARAEARRCLACGECGNCRACVDLFACPALIEHPSTDTAYIDQDLCIDCGACVPLCSNGAIVSEVPE